jgi:hypothetical protein
MKLRLVIHTCSNEHVAQAALLSLGGELAARVAIEADRSGYSVGGYVARALRDFDQDSDLADRAAVEQVMRGADQPILAGLNFILGHSRRAYQPCADC